MKQAYANIPSGRLASIDALRGFDMFWIIGADSLVYALRGMTPNHLVNGLATQLEHTNWSGFHFYDLIFPLFIFLAGVSIPFSLSHKKLEVGRKACVIRICLRTAYLFVLGILYSGGVMNGWSGVRLMGVLNRIALVYFFSSILFCFVRTRGLIAVCVALLISYWAMMSFVSFPDVRPTPATKEISRESGFTNIVQLNMASQARIHGKFDEGVNLANYVDQKYLPGYKYDGTWDPEGLLSTLPSIATCLLGVFAGLLLIDHVMSDKQKVEYLVLAGLMGVSCGLLWGLQFPVVKKIWSSSFVLVAGGYSAIFLAGFYLIIDVWKKQKLFQPFIWLGMNSIAIYMTANLIGGFPRLANRFVGRDAKVFCDNHILEGSGDLIVSIIGLGLAFWFARFLYRNGLFLRL